MRRREFIMLVGGAAAWPVAARAQQPERVRHVGVLMSTGEDDPETQFRLDAFVQGLRQAGWSIGHNVRIDTRWASGQTARLRTLTAEMLSLKPETVKTRLHRARTMLRDNVEKKIGPVVMEAFPFAGKRCERLTDAVLKRLGYV